MILAFDIGTTVLKGALLSEDGEFLSLSSRNMSLRDTLESGFYESDSGEWIESFCSVSAELLSNFDKNRLRAVVISGNGPTLVPVAKDGTFLEPVMSWIDRRGTKQSEKIGQVQDFVIDPTFYLPKAMWIADNLPEVYEKTGFFLSCPESMAFWLTGTAVTILPGLKFEKYFWSDKLLSDLGLDKNKFPDFVKPGHVTGSISKSAAAASGLPEGIPVVSAGPDFVVTLLGTAAVYPGRACDRSGTSEGINLCTETYVEDPRLMGYGHVVEPLYNVSGIISTSGKALEWIKAQLTPSGTDVSADYSVFIDAAASSPSGADGLLFLPYLAGERAPHWDPSARGAFLGLGLHHDRCDMIRAVLESTGYAMRDVIEVMTENGGRVDEMRITGGPSKSGLWNQIKADITGRRLLVPESTESELLGNLVIALRALGDTDELAASADRIVRIKDVYEPDAGRHAIYSEYFELYRESYRLLKPLFGPLAAARERTEEE
ncbi:MAG: FGGY-family carbohydrate kinase [Spirochaetales bacterium]|uniref:FGGY-family carbohydrate kinase n=1 Tax=Candidatus Thalassospirochaeta sargassi TaxID=3119039 RepID=A0AAJ1IEZ1_9SPIO|nr:FGGY-family carbohydrate kinase [Spirochaetales bacterium]